MRTKCLFLKLAWAALTLALVFTACENAVSAPDEDSSSLEDVIMRAEAAKEGVVVSDDGKDVVPGTKWVTEDKLEALNDAIASAQALAGDAAAPQFLVNEAVSRLTEAISVFNNAKQNGTKNTGFTQVEFTALKTAANDAKEGIRVSVNGNGVPVTGYWVTQTVLDTFNAAIATAGTVVSDSAYLALSNALAEFNEAKQPGKGGSEDEDALEGTWVSDDNSLRLEASNGSFKQYLVYDNKEVVRGTYTVSGNAVTATITDVNTAMFGGTDRWYTWANLSSQYKEVMGGSARQEITIVDNTFTSNGMTFTKENGKGGNNGNILVITGIDASLVRGSEGVEIGIFPVGTTPEQAMSWTGIVAGATSYEDTVLVSGGPANYTVTAELYVPSTENRWTGSGTYAIYLVVIVGDKEDDIYFKSKQNVSFTSNAKTSVPLTSFEKLSDLPPTL
jgi:hypothetical protein